ncbi:uncharacterized protein LOC129580577 [Sitodiplosis mosellana]|uniref:uncharacterized protein LOC129580577 n=1 Tax=Sitodiplosis mosellana TaxID=263140 RepID=UPI0024441FE6|nr:uncharacterized protein LOC129580577 [Sitodiplosis mosellana]
MEALDLIEKRIDNLNRILGTLPSESEPTNSAATETLTDSLLSASTLLSSATSGREAINQFTKRSAELEKYLDPNFVEEQQDLRAKEVYLQMIAPELQETFDQLEEIKKLEPTLGAEYFRSMPNVTDKLKAMNETTSDLTQKNDLLEESLTLAMQRYDEIHQTLKDSLSSMNDRISRMEERMNKKKPLNEDI